VIVPEDGRKMTKYETPRGWFFLGEEGRGALRQYLIFSAGDWFWLSFRPGGAPCGPASRGIPSGAVFAGALAAEAGQACNADAQNGQGARLGHYAFADRDAAGDDVEVGDLFCKLIAEDRI